MKFLKLVTIFIEWPKLNLYEYILGRDNIMLMEEQLYYESFQEQLSKFINSFEKNNCNIIFKSHPFESGNISDNILTIYNMKENCKNDRPGKDGKVPTVTDITDHIYYLRWEKILPF